MRSRSATWDLCPPTACACPRALLCCRTDWLTDAPLLPPPSAATCDAPWSSSTCRQVWQVAAAPPPTSAKREGLACDGLPACDMVCRASSPVASHPADASLLCDVEFVVVGKAADAAKHEQCSRGPPTWCARSNGRLAPTPRAPSQLGSVAAPALYVTRAAQGRGSRKQDLLRSTEALAVTPARRDAPLVNAALASFVEGAHVARVARAALARRAEGEQKAMPQQVGEGSGDGPIERARPGERSHAVCMQPLVQARAGRRRRRRPTAPWTPLARLPRSCAAPPARGGP